MTREPPSAPPVRRDADSIKGDLSAQPGAVAGVRREIVEFARVHGAAPPDLDGIALAVSEAAGNVVRHAYPPWRPGRLRFAADVVAGDLQIVIEDDGDGLDSDTRQPGPGLGLQLIAALASDFALTRLEGGGFNVWMRFVLTGEDDGATDAHQGAVHARPTPARVDRLAVPSHDAAAPWHAQVIEAVDDERRRIASDLHDGIQQHLTVLLIRLSRLVDVIGDAAGASALVREIHGQAEAAMHELRDLVSGIYPAVLTHGLESALRAAARRAPIDTWVNAHGVGRYEPAIERAIYFICMEAIENVLKHAHGASLITITLTAHDDRLEFEVLDNGPGARTEFTAPAIDGHGVISIHTRIAAVGGSIQFTSRPGTGTRVHGSVPTFVA